ncbi:NnrS family protein [Pseudophaeobacter sp.]|uniref:NnrS family protein n=1 Tax=Pseudophaeobacter sp. TaxID=1971739 RepID=UPI0032970821
MAKVGKFQSLNQRYSTFWQAPHRPLFLLSYLCALCTVAWWPLAEAIDLSVSLPVSLPAPLFVSYGLWHAHELLFGFAGAALGGYLLTALPSWTGGALLAGWPLKLLVVAWAGERAVVACAELLPLGVVLLGGGGYFLCLSLLLLREILRAKAYRKLGFAILVLALGGGNQLFLISALTGATAVSHALLRGGLCGFCLLIVVVGSRAVPAFTNNWLAQSGRAERIAVHQQVGGLAFGLLTAGLLVGAVLSALVGWDCLAYGACLILSVILLWQMRHWQCTLALRNPLLAALHLGYLWLPLGLMLLGANGLWGAQTGELWMPPGDALHSLTIGAMAGMIMAISGRAAAHHHSGEMRATLGFRIGFGLIWICTWLRLMVGVVPDHGAMLISLAAGVWCLGWLAFVVGFFPALRGPIIRPVLSGKRHQNASKLFD